MASQNERFVYLNAFLAKSEYANQDFKSFLSDTANVKKYDVDEQENGV